MFLLTQQWAYGQDIAVGIACKKMDCYIYSVCAGEYVRARLRACMHVRARGHSSVRARAGARLIAVCERMYVSARSHACSHLHENCYRD